MNSTLFIALSLIFFIAAFIIILKRVGRYEVNRDNNKLIQQFDDLVMGKDLKIEMKELLNRRIIGIDKANQKLLFIDKSKEAGDVQLLNLPKLSFSTIVRRKNAAGHLICISIECRFKDGRLPVYLIFYDEHYDDIFRMEAMQKKAEYWNQAINIYKDLALVK